MQFGTSKNKTLIWDTLYVPKYGYGFKDVPNMVHDKNFYQST